MQALSLLTSSSSAAGFALNAQRKETARSTTNELRFGRLQHDNATHNLLHLLTYDMDMDLAV